MLDAVFNINLFKLGSAEMYDSKCIGDSVSLLLVSTILLDPDESGGMDMYC